MPDPKITLLSVLFLVGAAQGIFFVVALLTSKIADKAATRYLALLLLLLSSELVSEFLDHSQYGLQYIRWMIFIFPIDFLYGPLVWLYTTKMCSREARGARLNTYLHFVPTLLIAPLVWQLMFQPLTDDANFFIDHPILLQANQIQSWISLPYTQLLAILSMSAYLAASLWQLHRHSVAIANEFSYRDGVALSWLSRLLWALVALVVMFVLRSFIADRFEFVALADAALNAGIVLVIYAMAYFAARQPRIFTQRIGRRVPVSNNMTAVDIPQPATGESDPIESKESGEKETKAAKYSKSALDTDMSARILKRLNETMEQEKPYLENNLTLPGLAKRVSTSPHYLSQVINEQLQMSFFDLINSYRVETAKQLIIDPLPHTKTILDIAMASAFNSKSAFYTAFKKQMGITPSEFKRKHFQVGQ